MGCVGLVPAVLACTPRPTQPVTPPSPGLRAPADVLQQEQLWAPAPSGMALNLLGVPVDVDFRPLAGEGSVVPSEFVDDPTTTNRFSSDWGEIDSEAELRASVNAWLVSGGVAASSGQRMITLDNLFVRSTHALRPEFRIRTPPEQAHYVITAIDVGHLVQVRFAREESALSAHLAAEIKKFGASASALKQKLGVEATIYALGVNADDGKGALQRMSEDEFVREFSANPEDAVPVRVRYTPIRGRKLVDGKLEWARRYKVHVAPGKLRIADDGTWNSTKWEFRLACLRNKTPLRRRDYVLWQDVNPHRNAEGTVVDRTDRNETSINLWSRTFDGPESVDLTTRWVEFSADEGDDIACSITLRTKDNPFDDLERVGNYEIVSRRVRNQTLIKLPTVLERRGKYEFRLPVTVEVRPE